MEVYEQSEYWEESADGEFAFDHTKLILKRGDQFFWAKAKQRYRGHLQLPEKISELGLEPIPTHVIWPALPQKHTLAPKPLPVRCYVKQPSLLECGDHGQDFEAPSDVLFNEFRICELLRQKPHCNVATYLGCLASNGKITGLCFTKYDKTLAQMDRETLVSNPSIYAGIQHGVHYLHRMGLIHGDLSEHNIMMDGDTPVIIDFGSCRLVGEKLAEKRGFFIQGIEHASALCDELGLQRIYDFIHGLECADPCQRSDPPYGRICTCYIPEPHDSSIEQQKSDLALVEEPHADLPATEELKPGVSSIEQARADALSVEEPLLDITPVKRPNLDVPPVE